jgi:tetratricopeptide (TPR) repeat protein
MSKCISLPICFFAILLSLSTLTNSAAQTAPTRLGRAEVLALVGGRALPANIVHAIRTRGLTFRPTDEYRAQLKTAGADASVLVALNEAKLPDSTNPPDKSEQQLLQSLTRAAELIEKKRYDDAVDDLTATLTANVAVPEAGFVMGAILLEKQQWPQAAAVYSEVLREDPNFPEAHSKLSYLQYKLGDSDSAFREAKAALAENPDNAEAHKNLGLALFMTGRLDAAILEYREALRLKPDYGAAHLDIGLVLEQKHDPEAAIAEYRKAVKLEPDIAAFHYGLGSALGDNGDPDGAIRELREAKRLDPSRLDVRHNLAANLEHRDMHAAVREFLELEKMAPDFQLCEKCLAGALHAIGDDKASLERYRRAAELDPTDPDVPLQLGKILEEQKNYDGALSEYRKAEDMSGDYSAAHLAVGSVLLTKKEYSGALQELRKAAALSPADAPTHEMLARALRDSGDIDGAIGEFKEAQSLDPKRSSATMSLAQILEKKGDWPAAFDRYRQAALTEAASNNADHHGQAFFYSNEAQSQYRSAQIRLEEHIQSLKTAGRTKEAADLQSRIAATLAAGGTSVQLQELIHAGDEARGERRFPDAELSYQKAVELAEKSAPSDELLITTLENLGGIYGIRQNYGRRRHAPPRPRPR